MIDLAYYNGVITPYDSACIPLSDRAIFFGDAVYDVILGHRGVPYQLDEHLARLMRNADAIGLGGMPPREEIVEAIAMTVAESGAEDFLLYVQLSADSVRRAHSRKGSGTNLLITVTSAHIPNKLDFISAITLPDIRHGYCNVKTTNLLASVLSIGSAESAGDDVAIFHKDGIVTEASHANVSLLINDSILTHPLDSAILPGIAQANIVKICTELGISHREQSFSLEQLKGADAILVSSTTKLLKVCNRLDGAPLECSGLDTAKLIFDNLKKDILS